MQSHRISWIVAAWLTLPSCWAEQNDRNQPIQVEADQVVMNETEQVSTFTGNVQIHQGTMQILGDKIVVTQNKQGYKTAKVYGSTASFRQKREGLNEYVEGYGERIEYDTLKQTVDIYGQARLKRDQDFIRGEHINYDSLTEVFIVDNGAPSSGAPRQRVRAIIQPHSQPGSVPAEKK